MGVPWRPETFGIVEVFGWFFHGGGKGQRYVFFIFKFSLSQWLNFKLSGITCLVGKIKFISQGPLAE